MINPNIPVKTKMEIVIGTLLTVKENLQKIEGDVTTNSEELQQLRTNFAAHVQEQSDQGNQQKTS